MIDHKDFTEFETDDNEWEFDYSSVTRAVESGGFTTFAPESALEEEE